MKWIDNARIFAQIAVVTLHISSLYVYGIHQYNTMYWWFGNLIDSAMRWCVPVFVMLSGYLLLDPNKSYTIKSFYQKRMNKILLPFLFWTLIYTLWSGFLYPEQRASWFINLPDKLLQGSAYYHLWYFPMLILLYLMTPLLRKLTAALSDRQLTVVSMALMTAGILTNTAAVYLQYSTSPLLWKFISYPLFAGFYIAGWLIGKSQERPPIRLLWSIFIVAAVCTALGCYLLTQSAGFEQGLYFYSYLSITDVPMSLAAFLLIRQVNKPLFSPAPRLFEKLAPLTFGVYLIHPLFIDAASMWIVHPLALAPWMGIPLFILLVLGGSLLLAYLLSRLSVVKNLI